MKDQFSNEDPSEQWPEEVKEAYKSLKIPSIYDAVLANEKLSLEIHKQNHDIKEVLDRIRTMSSAVQTMMQVVLEQADEDETNGNGFPGPTGTSEFYPMQTDNGVHTDNGSFAEEGPQYDLAADLRDFIFSINEILMEATDTLIELSKNSKELIGQLNEAVTVKEKGNDIDQASNRIIDRLSRSLVDNVDSARYRLVARLQDVDIRLIDPLPGDPLIPEQHRVLDRIPGGEPETIARTIRAGYLQNDEILRQAEVIIY